MTTVYVDGQDCEVENLTVEQVFYLLQCRPARLTMEQLEDWRQAAYSEGHSDGVDYGLYCCEQ